MKTRTLLLLLASHVAVGGVGFGLGVYTLPILIAPEAPSEAAIREMHTEVLYTAAFRRGLADSDAFHWGEGELQVGAERITFVGELAPGPDYKLYLSPSFVETEADFARLKPAMVRVGDVDTFENFVVDLPAAVDPAAYTSAVVWCETFGEFITAAQYRP